MVNTSEFNDVKARLAMMHNHRKVDKSGSEPPDAAPDTGHRHRSRWIDEPERNVETDDERPTLKRRDSGSGSGGNGNGNNQ